MIGSLIPAVALVLVALFCFAMACSPYRNSRPRELVSLLWIFLAGADHRQQAREILARRKPGINTKTLGKSVHVTGDHGEYWELDRRSQRFVTNTPISPSSGDVPECRCGPCEERRMDKEFELMFLPGAPPSDY
jgi:hypothetical protein